MNPVSPPDQSHHKLPPPSGRLRLATISQFPVGARRKGPYLRPPIASCAQCSFLHALIQEKRHPTWTEWLEPLHLRNGHSCAPTNARGHHRAAHPNALALTLVSAEQSI